MMTMRLQRLHLSSNPPPTTLAISCPHSQRVSLFRRSSVRGVLCVTIGRRHPLNEIENDY